MARRSIKDSDGEARDAFSVGKGVLTVNTDLHWEYLDEFTVACTKLLESRKNNLEVNMLSVNFISSSFVGCLGDFVFKAARLKKKVVLKVSLDVSWLFDIMGGQRFVEMVVV